MKQFPGPTELLLCEHFNPMDKRYERECPTGYNGCLTQTSEPHVLRMCSDHGTGINDCKMANGVHYCFCSGKDLCNGNTSQFPTRSTARPVPRPTTDDDDEEPTEGSGDFSTPTKNNYSPTTARPPHGTTITNNSPSRGSAISRTLGLLPLMAALVTATAQ